jgi:hypothetical protein
MSDVTVRFLTNSPGFYSVTLCLRVIGLDEHDGVSSQIARMTQNTSDHLWHPRLGVCAKFGYVSQRLSLMKLVDSTERFSWTVYF